MGSDEGDNRMIEQILIKKTLKAGDNVWEEGKVMNSPLPQALLDEIKARTGTIEVLKGGEHDPEKLIFVAQRVEDKPNSTATSQIKTASGPEALNKPEAQLKQEQRPRHKPKPKVVLRRRKK